MALDTEESVPKFAVPRTVISSTHPQVETSVQPLTSSAISPEFNTTNCTRTNSSVYPEVNTAAHAQANSSVYPEVIDDTTQSRTPSAAGLELNTALYAQANSSVYPEVNNAVAQPKITSVIRPESSIARHAQDNSSVYPEVNPLYHPEIYSVYQGGVENGGNDGFTVKEQNLVNHRIDKRLVIVLGFLYAVSVMDRINVSFALLNRYRGYFPDSHIIAYTVYFIAYIILQPVTTILVRTLGSRPFLAGLTLAFGLVTVGTAFVQAFGTLYVLRVFLGALQAGILSCSIYLISSWYHRYDVGKRFAFFYSFGCIMTILGSFLAVGFAHLPAFGAVEDWGWVFIGEGVITCIVAIITYFYIVDFPDKAHETTMFLTDRETKFVQQRINKDRGDCEIKPFKLSEYLSSGSDIKVWAFALLFFANTTVTYSLDFFIWIIVGDNSKIVSFAGLGLSAGALVFAVIVMIVTGIIGDRTHSRGPIILFNALLQFIGSIMVGYSGILGAEIAGLFLMTAGAYANIPTITAYQANNIRGQWKRAYTSATLVAFGGIGGVAGSLIFRLEANPNFSSDMYYGSLYDYGYYSGYMELARHGIWATMVCALLSMIIVGLLSWKFFIDNRKEARGEIHLEKSEMGFRYTY